MKNIIKLLSKDKEFRIVVVDTQKIVEKQLQNFRGSEQVLQLLKHVTTNCILFSAMDDFNKKISFSLRLTNNISIFCMIANGNFSIEYSDKLNSYNDNLSHLFDEKASLSITKGDWHTGLFTGTVEAHIDNIDMLFAYFSVQSEQLPSNFIVAGTNPNRGVMVQPLPFADEKKMAKIDYELNYLSNQLAVIPWHEVCSLYQHLAKVITQFDIEG